MGTTPEEELRLDDLLAEFLARFTAREIASVEEYCALQTPSIRARLKDECQRLLALHQELQSLAEGAPVTAGEQRILGPYRILELLGEGGSGQVFRAQRLSDGLEVALKVIPRGAPERTRQRFQVEGSLAARLDHPSIARVLDTGEAQELLYHAMELVPGRTLAQCLRDAAEGAVGDGFSLGVPGDPDHARRAASIVAEIAEALGYAHEQGVIHRDVKTSNIVIRPDGRAVLIDLGLAKIRHEISISATGDLMGTVAYMSPEQTLAKRIPVDARTDVFSLGIVLYEVLAGRRPFGGPTDQAVLYAINFGEPEPLRSVNPRVPRDLEILCHKALEKRPDRRFESARRMAEELRRFLQHQAIGVRPPSLARRAARFLRRRPRRTLVAGLILLALLLLGGGRMLEARRALERRLDPIRTLAERSLDQVAPEELVVLSREIRQLRAQEALGAAELRLLDVQEGRILQWAQERRVRAMKGVVESGTNPFQDQAGLLRLAQAMKEVTEAQLCESVPAPLEISPLFPLLRVASDPRGARVLVQELDLMDGRPKGAVREIGTTPLQEVPVPPGYYRILLAHPEGEAEFTRLLGSGDLLELSATLRSREEITEGMVRVESRSFRYGQGVAGPPHGDQVIEDLPAFWIDRTEVSNWHYREFLASLDPEAAQRHRPIWYPEEWSTRLDWLPVCGVSFTSAQAFAEWAGKRLPSALEWERAARGTDGRVTPRPDLPTEEYANIGKPFFPPSLEPEAYHDWVCQNLDKALAPVDSGEEGCSPEGLFHVLGNVREWTETMHSVVLRPSQPPVQSAMQYHAKGGAWDQPGPIATLHYFSPTSIEFDDITLGFRCAKSDFPER